MQQRISTFRELVEQKSGSRFAKNERGLEPRNSGCPFRLFDLEPADRSTQRISASPLCRFRICLKGRCTAIRPPDADRQARFAPQ